MSIWSRFIKALENSNGHSSEMTAEKRDPSRYAIVDVEVGTKDHKINDIAKMQTTLSEWKTKCYEVKSASVRFIVAWKPKDAPKEESETAVLLADLTLCKS